MFADCAFAAGRGHDVCQDYAAAGGGADEPYAILADGCSTSPDTDVGARLLVKCIERPLASAASLDGPAFGALFADAVVRASAVAS